MRAFDQIFIDEVIGHFESLQPDQAPLWGSMRPKQVLAHLTTAVRYGLGKEPLTPNEGGFLGQWIVGPVLLNGWLKLPKNVKAPKMYDASAPEAEIETFLAELQEHLRRATEGTLDPPPHPYFGEMDAGAWGRLHIIHFEHHLRQFGRKLRIRN